MPPMVNPSQDQLKGRYVRFRVRDIYLPEPAAVLRELHDDEELQGRVLDLSDDARVEGHAFAIVEVSGLRQPCILSVDRLLPPL